MPKEIEVSLTTFIDFVFASGTPKITCVRNAKKRYLQPYEPRKDFWRLLRSGIIDMHQRRGKLSTLDTLLHDLRDPRKSRLYGDCIDGYKRWLGRRAAHWVPVQGAFWKYEDLIVSVNPELGLEINGQRHCIKLYFKQVQLTKHRVQAVLHLLRMTANNHANTMLGILDVSRAKFIPVDAATPGIGALLDGEAQSFSTMWRAL